MFDIQKPLYYSRFTAYEDCPQKALWSYGWPTIDLGFGLGKRKEVPPRSEHHPVMGNVIGKVIEHFYNNVWWKEPAECRAKMKQDLDLEFERQLAKANIDWNLMPRQEMYQICHDGVMGFLSTLKQHKLLGTVAHAEVNLMGFATPNLAIGGRADIIIVRDDLGTVILDGKNGKRNAQGVVSVDEDQLHWYALCFKLSYHRIPDKLGFVWFRYPYGTPIEDKPGEVEQGVTWIEVSADKLKELTLRAENAVKAMHLEHFHATPSPKTCNFCDFKEQCDARKQQREANSIGRKKSTSEGFGVEGGEITTIGLDD